MHHLTDRTLTLTIFQIFTRFILMIKATTMGMGMPTRVLESIQQLVL
jgi:hypothetical protein